MPHFDFIAIDDKNTRKTGQIEAESYREAKRRIKSSGLKIVSVKRHKKGLNEINVPGMGSEKIKPKDLVVFTRQLSTMVSAGVPLVKSVNTLATQTESTGLRRQLKEVSKDLEGGMTFADALAKHPKAFDPIFVNMV